MKLADSVEAYNKATLLMNILGPKFYDILLPWQGKKVVKKDGWVTKNFSEAFSTSESFNYREEGFEVRTSCGGTRGVILRVAATFNGAHWDVYYYAGDVSFNQFTPNPNQGVLEKVNTFNPGQLYEVKDVLKNGEVLKEAEKNLEKAKNAMGIFLHYCC